MADSQSLGEILVSIIADTSKLDSGLNKANKSIDDFGKKGKTAAKNTEDLQEGLDKTGSEAEDAGEQVKGLANNINQESKAAGNASENNKKNSKSIEGIGEVAGGAKKALGLLKGALGAIGITVGVAELISKFKELVEHIREANDEYQDYVKQMNQSVGANYVMGDRAKELYDYSMKNLTIPYGEENIKEAASFVAKVYSDASDEIQKAIMEEFLTQNYMGKSIGASDLSTNMNQFNTIAKKYELTDDEMAESLAYLRATTQDTNVSLTDLEAAMLSLEDYAKVMGLTFKEVADMIASAADSGNLDDIETLGSSFTSAFANAINAKKDEILSSEDNTLTGKELQKSVTEWATNFFKNGLQDAMKSNDKFELGAYLADNLGISASKTTGMAAGILTTQNDETDRTNRDMLESSKKQIEEMGLSRTALEESTKAVQKNNEINESFQESMTKVAAGTLEVTKTSGNVAGGVYQDYTGRDARNEEVKKALEGEAEWTVETMLQAAYNTFIASNPFTFFGELFAQETRKSIVEGFDSEVIQNVVDNINAELDKIDPSDVEGMVKVLQEGKEELERIGKSTNIDTSVVIESLNNIELAIINGDEGLIPTIELFGTSLENSQIKIDNVSIPANDRLCDSIQRVIDKYHELARAKANAGM